MSGATYVCECLCSGEDEKLTRIVVSSCSSSPRPSRRSSLVAFDWRRECFLFRTATLCAASGSIVALAIGCIACGPLRAHCTASAPLLNLSNAPGAASDTAQCRRRCRRRCRSQRSQIGRAAGRNGTGRDGRERDSRRAMRAATARARTSCAQAREQHRTLNADRPTERTNDTIRYESTRSDPIRSHERANNERSSGSSEHADRQHTRCTIAASDLRTIRASDIGVMCMSSQLQPEPKQQQQSHSSEFGQSDARSARESDHSSSSRSQPIVVVQSLPQRRLYE